MAGKANRELVEALFDEGVAIGMTEVVVNAPELVPAMLANPELLKAVKAGLMFGSVGMFKALVNGGHLDREQFKTG